MSAKCIKLYFLLFIFLVISVESFAQSSSSSNYPLPLNLLDQPETVSQYWGIVYRQPPVYPRRAINKNLSGCAVFTLTISSSGKAENIKLFDTKPGTVFENAAKKALYGYRWQATKSNSAKIPVDTSIVVEFEIEPNSSRSGKGREYLFDGGGRNSCDLPNKDSTQLKKEASIPKSCAGAKGSRLLKTCN